MQGGGEGVLGFAGGVCSRAGSALGPFTGVDLALETKTLKSDNSHRNQIASIGLALLGKLVCDALMSKAAELIVSGYVGLKNRRALQELLGHRRKLLDRLERVSGIGPMQVVDQIRQEIVIIETGLKRLDAAGAQEDVEVPPQTAREFASNSANGVPAPLVTVDTTSGEGQLAPAPATEAEIASPPTPAPEQESTPIRVLGLVVSIAATAPVVSSASGSPPGVAGLDPGAFALGAPSSNEPAHRIEQESNETETAHSAVDAFKSFLTAWSDESRKR